MNTIFDQHSKELMKDHELSSEHLRLLFELLHKLDPESMDGGCDWTDADPEDDRDDNFYLYAIANFFAIHTGNLVAKNFGEAISEMCFEFDTDKSEFGDLPFVKIIKEMAEEMHVEKIKEQTPVSSIIVINP